MDHGQARVDHATRGVWGEMGLLFDVEEVCWNMKSPAALRGKAKWEMLDKESTMRYVCCAVALLVLVAAMAGCATQFVTRTYPLGPKPKAAQEVIAQITMDEHKGDLYLDTSTGVPLSIMKAFEAEDAAVVRTTRHGHELIKAALEELRKQ